MILETGKRILENANELIISIARDSLAEGERLSERGDEPTIMFRTLGRNIEFGCKHHLNVGLTRTQP